VHKLSAETAKTRMLNSWFTYFCCC